MLFFINYYIQFIMLIFEYIYTIIHTTMRKNTNPA